MMRWLQRLKSSYLVALALEQSAKDALGASKMLESAKIVRTAGSNGALNLYFDPNLSDKYKINLHLMEQNDAERRNESKGTSPREELLDKLALAFEEPKRASSRESLLDRLAFAVEELGRVGY